jgi:hypothetical protein
MMSLNVESSLIDWLLVLVGSTLNDAPSGCESFCLQELPPRRWSGTGMALLAFFPVAGR